MRITINTKENRCIQRKFRNNSLQSHLFEIEFFLFINQIAINNESGFEVALKHDQWSIYWIEKENVLI